ncbi:MAG: hypothetical protein ACRDSF_00670 [Pseudonocardiaceae bacterium]
MAADVPEGQGRGPELPKRELPVDVPDAPHGTLAGYQTWGCRCGCCQAAQRAEGTS